METESLHLPSMETESLHLPSMEAESRRLAQLWKLKVGIFTKSQPLSPGAVYTYKLPADT